MNYFTKEEQDKAMKEDFTFLYNLRGFRLRMSWTAELTALDSTPISVRSSERQNGQFVCPRLRISFTQES